MGIIGGRLGYLMLRKIAPVPVILTFNQEISNKLDTNLGRVFCENFFSLIQGKTVIDFGCGDGRHTVEMAVNGAAKVIGIDIQNKLLSIARELAKKKLVADHCFFVTETDELADIIVSKDAFEHFSDPVSVLDFMHTLLKPNGFILASFGPTWLHPYGGHLFSVFPWAHLIFTENALIRWRSDFKSDGATKFSEVEGGLNKLTIRKFEKIIRDSPFNIEWLDTIPIKGFYPFKYKAIREFGSSIVRCKLIPKKAKISYSPYTK
ncbi:MAG: class I SAM-dependent methyltransferase [Nitrosomonas ureae]